MKAIVRTAHEKGAVSVRDVPSPTIEAQDQVSVRVAAAGLCGSDVGAYLAKPEYRSMSTPAVLGHEIVGVVETTGDAVQTVASGDRVVIWPGDSCGECFQCRTGRRSVCPNQEVGDIGFGGFAPTLVARAKNVHRVPDGVPTECAALAEPLAVTHRAVVRTGGVAPGDSVLVQGPGPMGTFSAFLAERAGGNVVVTGLAEDTERLERLSNVGIETANTKETELSAVVEEHAQHDGFDVTIDATGASDGVQQSVAATCNGGTVVVLGIVSGDVSLDIASLVRSEIDVRTSYGGGEVDFERVLDILAREDRPPVEDVIDTGFSPQNPKEAFESFVSRRTIKPVFDIRELRDEAET